MTRYQFAIKIFPCCNVGTVLKKETVAISDNNHALLFYIINVSHLNLNSKTEASLRTTQPQSQNNTHVS